MLGFLLDVKAVGLFSPVPPGTLPIDGSLRKAGGWTRECLSVSGGGGTFSQTRRIRIRKAVLLNSCFDPRPSRERLERQAVLVAHNSATNRVHRSILSLLGAVHIVVVSIPLCCIQQCAIGRVREPPERRTKPCTATLYPYQHPHESYVRQHPPCPNMQKPSPRDP